MADVSEVVDGDEPAAKGGKKGLLVMLIGALVAGGGGFFATYSGMLGGGESQSPAGHVETEYSFVPLDSLIVSLGPRARAQTLKFTAELEVEPEAQAEVEVLRPRILDVLNDYLRAVEEAELEDPAALSLLRAQMLRRIQTVVGDGKVRDLLILEFILS